MFLVAILTVPDIDFSDYEEGQARKDAFIAHFKPIIAAENSRLSALRKTLLALDLAGSNKPWLQDLASKYHVEYSDSSQSELIDELLQKVDAIPMSLALAQAANDSAWGISRFAAIANNYFGQWCFEKAVVLYPIVAMPGPAMKLPFLIRQQKLLRPICLTSIVTLHTSNLGLFEPSCALITSPYRGMLWPWAYRVIPSEMRLILRNSEK